MDGWVGRAAAALVWWVVSRMDGMKDFIKVEHRLICCKITRSNLNTLSRFFLNTKRTTENRCGSKTVCARTPLHANLNKHIRDFRKQQQFQRLLLKEALTARWTEIVPEQKKTCMSAANIIHRCSYRPPIHGRLTKGGRLGGHCGALGRCFSTADQWEELKRVQELLHSVHSRY